MSESIKSDYDPVVPELEIPKSPIHIPGQPNQISESPDPTTLPECDQAIRFADAERFNNSISMQTNTPNDEFNKIKNKNDPSEEEPMTVIQDLLHDNVNNDHLDLAKLTSPETIINECSRSDSPPPIVEPSDYYNENKFFETDDDYIDSEQQNNEHHFACLPSLKLDSLNSSGNTSPDVRSLKNEEISDRKSIDSLKEDHFENIIKPQSIESTDENFDDSGFDQQTSQTDTKIDTEDLADMQKEETTPIDGADKCNDFNNFDADFSQFESSFPTTNFSAETEVKIVENVKISEISQFDEDDFDDFTEFTSNSNVVTNKQTVITDNVENDEEDDDDFGDFSDFTQSQSTNLTTQLEHGSTQIASVLTMMFPNVNLNENENDICDETLENVTTSHVKNFENSKALEHQWLTSTGKNALVTALGIDIRNIVSFDENVAKFR